MTEYWEEGNPPPMHTSYETSKSAAVRSYGFFAPDELTPTERRAEIVAILATGFLRMRTVNIPDESQAQSIDSDEDKPANKSDQCLDLRGPQSVYGEQKERIT